MKRLAAMLVALLVSGCVTEGDTPRKPKPADERVQAQLDLARGYLEKRDIAKARRPLEQALEIDPGSVEANVLMAMIYQVEGEKKLAESAYRQALRSDPAHAMARYNYGTFLYGEGRYDEARKQLLVAVEDTTYNARAQAYEALGLSEVKLGDLELAEKSLQRALMLNAGQTRAMLELADLYYARGTYPPARQYYDAYAKLVPRQSARSLWLGIRIARVFDDANAVSSYALALKNLYPGSEEYRLFQESEK
jgi:type IV pilus assembly protein PilF